MDPIYRDQKKQYEFDPAKGMDKSTYDMIRDAEGYYSRGWAHLCEARRKPDEAGERLALALVEMECARVLLERARDGS